MAEIKIYPFKFKTVLKSPIWGTEEWIVSAIPGSESIIANGALAGKTLSEVIMIDPKAILGEKVINRYGAKFPLLIKYIKAESDLSIQVHPNDELAQKRHNCLGKNEMWMVLEATDNAKLLAGFNQDISKAEYLERVKNGTLTEVLNNCDVTVGDIFYIPAGRIHAIGAGCFILEVQQSSDITYRIYDYNRKDANGNLRELHTDLAVDAIDYTAVTNLKERNGGVNDDDLVNSEYFHVRGSKVSDNLLHNIKPSDSFSIIICVEGSGVIKWGKELENDMHIAQYDCVFLPARFSKGVAVGKFYHLIEVKI